MSFGFDCYYNCHSLFLKEEIRLCAKLKSVQNTLDSATGHQKAQNSQGFQSHFLSAKSPTPPELTRPERKQAKEVLFLGFTGSEQKQPVKNISKKLGGNFLRGNLSLR